MSDIFGASRNATCCEAMHPYIVEPHTFQNLRPFVAQQQQVLLTGNISLMQGLVSPATLACNGVMPAARGQALPEAVVGSRLSRRFDMLYHNDWSIEGNNNVLLDPLHTCLLVSGLGASDPT